jgi:uroporphyrinogen-III synthase
VRLLVTRPAPDGARTAAALCARGHVVMLAPLLRINAVPADFNAGPWDGVVMTSANAARALTDHPRRGALLDQPAFVVGRGTAEAARAVGFKRVTCADGDVGDLVGLIGKSARSARLLYLAGADQASDLGAALAGANAHVETVVIYRAATQLYLPDDVRSALATGAIDGVLHFSARSAGAFVQATDAASLRSALGLRQFCLSPAVAQPLAAAGARDLRVAARPNEAALLELVGDSKDA